MSEEDRIATGHGRDDTGAIPDPMHGLEVLTSFDIAGPRPG